jgi:Tol biopolymer transport system component
MIGTRWRAALVGVGALAAVAVTGPASAEAFSAWQPAVPISDLPGSHSDVNTEYLDGCPILSPDGHWLFMATNRPNGVGALDVWAAHRDDTDEGFGAPVNLGPAVNSTANDFCPTPLRGNRLLFVSDRAGGCGGADIYVTRWSRGKGWAAPSNLGCAPTGPNTAGGEAGPSYVSGGAGYLFFSSNVGGNSDLYVSTGKLTTGFGAPAAITELNTAVEDSRPNVRRDGLEIVFDSNRLGGQGGADIWVSTRASLSSAWSAPANVGTAVNTAANETRASLSWDAETMLFGRAPGPEGQTDIYLTTRDEDDDDDD